MLPSTRARPAVTQLEPSDVVAVLVGEEARVAVAVFVEDRELRAGVGPLAAADQPGARGPRRQVDRVAELGDPRAVTVAAVTNDRLHPHRFRDLEDRPRNGRCCQRRNLAELLHEIASKPR